MIKPTTMHSIVALSRDGKMDFIAALCDNASAVAAMGEMQAALRNSIVDPKTPSAEVEKLRATLNSMSIVPVTVTLRGAI